MKLHKYGDGSFCKFKIPNDYQKAGVYILNVDESPKYVGECQNLSTRFNSGYGNISPRNCYTGGQQTNCRINKLILDMIKKGNHIKLFFQETNDRFLLEDMLIEKLHPEWNRTKRTGIRPIDKNQTMKSSFVSRSKYHNLQKYLQNSTKTKEVLKYSKIEDILGFELPRSAYEYGAWWSNGGHTQANAWLNAEWMVMDIVLTKCVTFVKMSSWPYTEIIDGKKRFFQCGTPFIQVMKKNKKMNMNICRKCGMKYSPEDLKKSKFCRKCGAFLTAT